ncbi:hypothetical protein Scep_017488 [Stephania cephalantha]|uniref:Uncharacterized protein n=1 Tax=Stephania cephalantha TaxID=152367 RepID=A0AAP0NVQ3_9MAGN
MRMSESRVEMIIGEKRIRGEFEEPKQERGRASSRVPTWDTHRDAYSASIEPYVIGEVTAIAASECRRRPIGRARDSERRTGWRRGRTIGEAEVAHSAAVATGERETAKERQRGGVERKQRRREREARGGVEEAESGVEESRGERCREASGVQREAVLRGGGVCRRRSVEEREAVLSEEAERRGGVRRRVEEAERHRGGVESGVERERGERKRC